MWLVMCCSSKRHQRAAADVRRRRKVGDLADHLPRQHRLQLQLGVVGREGRRDVPMQVHERLHVEGLGRGGDDEVEAGGQALEGVGVGVGFHAALDGLCLAHVPDDLSRPHIERGELREVLADWSLRCQGFHLYHPPNRRQAPPAFSVLVEALRYRG